LVNVRKEVDSISAELAVADPAHGLRELLHDIAAHGKYESYRGLTGRIHQDLEELDRQMHDANAAWELTAHRGQPPLQRVILYIDDLDRCRPDRVVEVLQAVNLLLSLRLFAVIVAVDPPWLRSALTEHYGHTMLPPEGNSRHAMNYLEKIFHLPFALRRPTAEQATTYLRDLLPRTPIPWLRPAPAQETAPRRSEAAVRRQPAPRTSPAPASATRPRPAAAGNRIDLLAQPLELSEPEHDFLPRLSPLLPTPRAMKKLVNLYRLLRISVHNQLDTFIGTTNTAPYQAAAVLLTTVTGQPARAAGLLTTIRDCPDENDITLVLRNSGATDIADWIDKNSPVIRETTVYQAWAPVVARFGFETYRLFGRSDENAASCPS
jgi:hypothetical protein